VDAVVALSDGLCPVILLDDDPTPDPDHISAILRAALS
jgi:hypothetical protein